jgi:hypothetical protein
LSNIVELDHRAIKRKQRFREFRAAGRTIERYEAMHMTRKGQARWVSDDDVQQQNRFIDKLSIWRPETSPTSSYRDLRVTFQSCNNSQ